MYPLDMVKTRLQLQGQGGASVSSQGPGKLKGAFQTVKGIVSNEGVGGLYRGLSPALARHLVYSSIRVTTFEQVAALDARRCW